MLQTKKLSSRTIPPSPSRSKTIKHDTAKQQYNFIKDSIQSNLRNYDLIGLLNDVLLTVSEFVLFSLDADAALAIIVSN